jgi:glycosyltransferase involved in cell wall biosynthesis
MPPVDRSIESIPRTVLLISYFFPPYPGVGGRRWAKFAKYLEKDGVEVHVISADNPLKETSAWTKDVEGNGGIHVHRLSGLCPRNLLVEPKTLVERALFRISGTALSCFTRGNMFDYGLFWRSGLLRKANELVEKHGIRHVIVTGAPFHVLFHALDLKKRHPDIRLISDFRDPWSDEKRYITHLPSRRYDWERRWELEVLRHSDVILSPSESLTELLRKKTVDPKARFVTLFNGFDPDDFRGFSNRERPADGKIRFVYAGTLYNEVEEKVYELLNVLAEMRSKRRAVYDRLIFSFFGGFPDKYARRVEQLGLNIVHWYGNVERPVLYQAISEGDYGIIFSHDDPVYTKVAKFFDYLALRRKTVFIGEPRSFGEYLEVNGIGFCCPTDGIGSVLEKIISEHDQGGRHFSSEFNVEQFSLPQLTQQLEALLL